MLDISHLAFNIKCTGFTFYVELPKKKDYMIFKFSEWYL